MRSTSSGRIDAVAGDGDHGRGMVKGISAAVEAAEQAAGRGAAPGRSSAPPGRRGPPRPAAHPGSSGARRWAPWGSVWGTTAHRPSDGDVADAVRAGMEAMQRLGKAQVGDKTMLDAFIPFVDMLSRAVSSVRTCRRRGAAAPSPRTPQRWRPRA